MQTDTNKRDKFILAIKSFFRWLIPGIGLKRWLLIILLGITLIGLGIAVLLIDLYRTTTGSIWLDILSFLSVRFLNRPLRAIIFGGSGLLLVGIGIHGLNRAMLKPFVKPGESVLETITSFRKKEKGPRTKKAQDLKGGWKYIISKQKNKPCRDALATPRQGLRRIRWSGSISTGLPSL